MTGRASRNSGIRARSAYLMAAALVLACRANAGPFEMDVVEAEDLRLLYFDPFQTHLVPHVLRNSRNSLAFQKRVFEWQPYESPTVILTDLSDYSNAGDRKSVV